MSIETKPTIIESFDTERWGRMTGVSRIEVLQREIEREQTRIRQTAAGEIVDRLNYILNLSKTGFEDIVFSEEVMTLARNVFHKKPSKKVVHYKLSLPKAINQVLINKVLCRVDLDEELHKIDNYNTKGIMLTLGKMVNAKKVVVEERGGIKYYSLPQ